MTDPKPATPATDQEIESYAWYLNGWGKHGDVAAMEMLVDMAPSIAARIAADAEIIKAKDEEIERLRSSAGSQTEQNSRAQVETLREALKAALGHCDCSDYHGKALIRCTEAKPCAGCHTTRTGQAALAATEPKG